MIKHGLILVAALFALGACNGAAKKDAGAGTAQGEVLPGSASDAMLPVDTVKSQAPLAPKSEGGVTGDAKGAKAGKPSAKATDAAIANGPEAKAEASPSPPQSPATD